MHDTSTRLSGKDFEILAMRLILAHLADDSEETNALIRALVYETGATYYQFELADATAREAAGWWKRANGAEKARDLLYRRLDRLLSA